MVSFFFLSSQYRQSADQRDTCSRNIKNKKTKKQQLPIVFFHFCSGLEFPFRHVILNHSSKITALKFLTSITPGPQYNAFIVY